MRIHGVQLKIDTRDSNIGFYRSHLEHFFKLTDPGDFLIFPEETNLPMLVGSVINGMELKVEDLESSGSNNIFDTFDAKAFRSIFLSFAEDLRNNFFSFFSEMSKKYAVNVLACGNIPESICNKNTVLEEIKIFNAAYVFNSKGNLVFNQKKVFLTETEKKMGLDSGLLEDVVPFTLENIKFGVAISLDAFYPNYYTRLSGSRIILQPDANNVAWNSYLGNGRWQPEEWMESAYYIAQRMPNVEFVINPMMINGLMGIYFEGESAIAKKADKSDDNISYVGNIPTTGFYEIVGPVGFDSHVSYERDALALQKLQYPEKLLSVDIG